MREVFYKENPEWFFESDDIGKTQHPPECYILEQRVRHDSAPGIYCVFRTHFDKGSKNTDPPWQSSTKKESMETYRQLRGEITAKGFTYVVNSDNF